MGDKLCVVMPVYNEEEAIGPVLEKWDKALKALGIDYEIRPYNDGSKDNSLAVMRKAAENLGGGVKVQDKPNGGHGNTILTGYRAAVADGFDWIFQIDSDDEMGPEKFGELWERRNDYDFLVGIRDGRVQALPRKVISFVSRLCVRLFYGKSVWDVNTPYRLMRASAFKEFYNQIPITTFAPNVILSGLAARHKLRCFETRVPQHDRTTGEVSIKKWKLLKAAAKSFWQTIVFALDKGAITGLLLGTGCCVATILALDYISFPWCDEVGTTDTAANVVMHGVWRSHLWPYSYNPLHINLLIGWMKIFGISHMSVCAFGVVTGYVLFWVLRGMLVRARIVTDLPSNLLYAVLFWGGASFMGILTNGRIDLLTALFTVLMVNELLYEGETRKFRLFIYAFLMMMAAVYPVPVVVMFGICLLVGAKTKEERIEIWQKGLIAGFGVVLAFAVSCGYYAYHRQLVRFLYTYFSYNSTISGIAKVGFVQKLVDGYTYDWQALIMFGISAIACLAIGSLRKPAWRLVAFIGLIPLLAKYSGRYESYYSWMFYLPVVCLGLWTLNKIGRKWLVWAIFAIALVPPICRIAKNSDRWNEMREAMDQAERAVAERSDQLYPGRQVAMSDVCFYYPLLRRGTEIWSAKKSDDYTPEEKFMRFVNVHIKDEARRDQVINLYNRFERQYSQPVPDDALIF